MPMANGMEEFFTVCNALNTNMNASYWYDYEETDLINIIFGPSHKFVFLDQKVKQRDAIFEQAKRICQTKSNWGYDSFWTKAAEELPKRYNQFLDNVDRNKDEYRRAMADYKAREEAEAAARRAEISAKNEAKRRAKEEAKSLAESQPDYGNKVDVPKIKDFIRGSHGRSIDTDTDFIDNDTYIFDDSAVGTFIKVYHAHFETVGCGNKTKDYYYPKYNKEEIHYKTAEDAARAGWVWEKKKLVRTIGMIDD